MSEQPAANHQVEPWTRQWQEETTWSVKELAKLCLGWNPDSDVLPDPAAYHAALEKILRAVRNKDLRTVDPPVQITREEFFYSEGPLCLSREAAAWAAKRFPAFPYRADAWIDTADSTPTLDPLAVLTPPSAAESHAQFMGPNGKVIDSPRQTPGQRLEMYRNQCGWSHEVLAEKVGLVRSSVDKHLKDRAIPRPQQKRTYATVFSDALGLTLSVSDLFD